jgi:peptidoglycan/xylan/chitin deacetylase (PgdA/CDA1 family)
MGGAWQDPKCQPVSPERCVLGKIGHEYYGIPRIMDILEENGLRGTFFLEVLAGLNGFRHDLAEAYGQIIRRGHDAQLHLHPNHYYYRMIQERRMILEQLPQKKDMIGTLPPHVQLDLLRKGIGLFREMTNKSPVAFRAGNFGASTATLEALEEVGIHLDSSFSAAYIRAGCMLDSQGAINGVWQQGAVWEVPVTTFETGMWSLRGFKPLNIEAVSLWEMKKVLEQAETLGLRAVTFIAHSFSLFKVADVQFRRLIPNKLVLGRFRALCCFLREQAERFHVAVFSEVEPFLLKSQEVAVPRVGTVVPVLRKAAQAVNRISWI